MPVAIIDPGIGLGLLMLLPLGLEIVAAGVASWRFFAFDTLGPVSWLLAVAVVAAPLLAVVLLRPGWFALSSHGTIVLLSGACVLVSLALTCRPTGAEG